MNLPPANIQVDAVVGQGGAKPLGDATYLYYHVCQAIGHLGCGACTPIGRVL